MINLYLFRSTTLIKVLTLNLRVGTYHFQDLTYVYTVGTVSADCSLEFTKSVLFFVMKCTQTNQTSGWLAYEQTPENPPDWSVNYLFYAVIKNHPDFTDVIFDHKSGQLDYATKIKIEILGFPGFYFHPVDCKLSDPLIHNGKIKRTLEWLNPCGEKFAQELFATISETPAKDSVSIHAHHVTLFSKEKAGKEIPYSSE